MKKMILMAFGIALPMALVSCSNDSSSGAKSYPFKVRMTDAPAPYSEVNVDIQAVEVTGANGQTVTLNTTAGVYNLLDLSNGTSTLLATSTLTDANVKQIRLVLGSNNTLVVDGTTYPLSTPSAQQSGLKLLVNQTLQADIENSILIDFDANASVVANGSGGYILKPVLRTIVEATTGNISGSIAAAGTLAVVSATAASGTVYNSSVAADGHFKIVGLPPGSYTVTITPDLPLLPTTITNVTVQAGATTSTGVIVF